MESETKSFVGLAVFSFWWWGGLVASGAAESKNRLFE